jgi:uncharacterized protein (DUF2132 family)
MARLRLVQEGYPSIDMMIVKNDTLVEQVVNNFDLSFCEIYFNGTTIMTKHMDQIQEKKGFLQPEYQESLLLYQNRFILQRINKYNNRGFQVFVRKTPLLIETFPELEKEQKDIIELRVKRRGEWIYDEKTKIKPFDMYNYKFDTDSSLESRLIYKKRGKWSKEIKPLIVHKVQEQGYYRNHDYVNRDLESPFNELKNTQIQSMILEKEGKKIIVYLIPHLPAPYRDDNQKIKIPIPWKCWIGIKLYQYILNQVQYSKKHLWILAHPLDDCSFEKILKYISEYLPNEKLRHFFILTCFNYLWNLKYTIGFYHRKRTPRPEVANLYLRALKNYLGIDESQLRKSLDDSNKIDAMKRYLQEQLGYESIQLSQQQISLIHRVQNEQKSATSISQTERDFVSTQAIAAGLKEARQAIHRAVNARETALKEYPGRVAQLDLDLDRAEELKKIREYMEYACEINERYRALNVAP